MFLLALQIITPLVIAALIGFTCAWLLRRHATLTACREYRKTRERLNKISAQLQTFRHMEQQMSTPSNRLNACVSELRMIDSELEALLNDPLETRRRIR
jgi:arsenate reductase-like glutaredoxin family protein